MAASGALVAMPHALFRLAREHRYCLLIERINKIASPTSELSALRVYALLRSGDTELAMVKLAQLLAVVTRTGSNASALQRWAGAPKLRRTQLNVLTAAVDDFYRDWDFGRYWKTLANEVRGRELDFVATAVGNPDKGWRILVAVADVMKLRGDRVAALDIYLSMCRVQSNPDLLHNVFALAVSVEPDKVYPLWQEFYA